MKNKEPRPPAAAQWILRRICSDRWTRTHLIDFREAFEDVAALRGRSAARRWYWRQTFKSLPGFFSNRFYWSLSMLRNYMVIAYRNMLKSKWFSLINLAGLAAGLAGVILIAVYVRFESSYDRFHEKSDRIYRVLSFAGTGQNGSKEYFDALTDPKVPALLAQVPEIVRSAKVASSIGDQVILQNGESSFVESGLFVDDHFFGVFSFPLFRGEREKSLAAAGSIVLTDGLARKLFGSSDPIGKPVVFKSKDSTYNLTVTGISADAPLNSHLRFSFLISLETLRTNPATSWMFGMTYYDFYSTYVELRRPEDAGIVAAKLKTLIQNAKTQDKISDLSLQPLTDIHLRSQVRGQLAGNNEIRFVRLFSAIALVLLLIAVINYINLATSRSMSRSKEIGIRKVTGADRSRLFRQFIGESLFMSGAALVLALVLARIFWPLFKSLVGIRLEYRTLWNADILVFSIAAALAVGVLSGLYPALVLSRLRPVRTLGEFAGRGRKGAVLRGALVVLQFGASFILLVGTFIIGRQMNFIRTANPGYNRDKVIIVPLRAEGTLKAAGAIRGDFLANPDVVGVSVSSYVPTRTPALVRLGAHLVKDDGTKFESICTVDTVDENFLALYDIELIRGRNLLAGETKAALVNEAMVRDAGWREPVGKTIDFGGSFKTVTIVGIFKNFHYSSLHKKIAPLALIPGLFPPKAVAVRMRPGNVPKMLAGLRTAFENRTRDQPFEFQFLDEIYDSIYRKEIRTWEFFRVFAVLTVFIACLGLSGLTALAIERRTREIGIRKVLGASAARLTAVLNVQFLALVTLANVIALPAAYLAMNSWLRSFAYRIDLNVGTFLLASAITLAVALATISFQTAKAARMNPADTLRCE